MPIPVTTKAALTRTRATKLRDSGSSVGRNVISAHTSCKQCDCLADEDGAKKYALRSAAGSLGWLGE